MNLLLPSSKTFQSPKLTLFNSLQAEINSNHVYEEKIKKANTFMHHSVDRNMP